MGFSLDTLGFLVFCSAIFYVAAKLIIDERAERHRNDLERRTQDRSRRNEPHEL